MANKTRHGNSEWTGKHADKRMPEPFNTEKLMLSEEKHDITTPPLENAPQCLAAHCGYVREYQTFTIITQYQLTLKVYFI